MDLNELIAHLQDIQNDLDAVDGVPVRVAFQPSYPLRGTISAITPGNPDEREDNDDATTVWIAINDVTSHNESPYAPRWAWDG